MASIELRFSEDPPEPQYQAYMMRVEAINAVDMPDEIFVFQNQLAPPRTGGGDPTDAFVSVADPLDLEEYPAGSPIEGNPYYRVSDITLMFRSSAFMFETKELIIQDVHGLVDAINKALTNPINEDIPIS